MMHRQGLLFDLLAFEGHLGPRKLDRLLYLPPRSCHFGRHKYIGVTCCWSEFVLLCTLYKNALLLSSLYVYLQKRQFTVRVCTTMYTIVVQQFTVEFVIKTAVTVEFVRKNKCTKPSEYV